MRMKYFCFLLIFAILLGCAKKPITDKNPEGGEVPQIANPASAYCVEQGGRLEIVESEGGQMGICHLRTGETCEEWAFFRHECPAAAPQTRGCVDACGNGRCEEIVCMATNCPCPETRLTCPQDCG